MFRLNASVLAVALICTLSIAAQRQLQSVLDAKMGDEPLNPYVWVASTELKLRLFLAGEGRRADPFEVIRLAQRGAELNPPLGRASLALAKTDLVRSAIFDATQHLHDAINLGAPRDEVLLVKAAIAKVINNEHDAQRALEEVIGISPAVELKAVAGVELGDLLQRQGKLDEAERQYRSAASLRSCTRVPDRRLGTFLIFARNKLAEAKTVLTQGNSPRPDAETSRLLETLDFFAWSNGSASPARKSEILKDLLQQSEISGDEILLVAAQFEAGRKLILDLLAAGVLQNVDAVDGKSNTALLIAARGNAGAVAEALVHRGARVNAQNSGGQRAIGLFSAHGNIEALKLLLGKGAELNYVDSNGNSPVSCAVAGSHVGAAKLLLQNGAKADVSELLTRAALNGNLPMVQMLVIAGADVNKQGQKVIPPLMAAVVSRDLPTIQYLLDKDADPATTYNGKSILEYARDTGDPALVKLLSEKRKVRL